MARKKTSNNFLFEILGWYGAFAIITAYGLISLFPTSTHPLVYQLLNLTGAVGIGINSFRKKDYQPGVLNVVWIVIALAAILKITYTL